MILSSNLVDVKSDEDLSKQLDLGVDLVSVASVRPSDSGERHGTVRKDREGPMRKGRNSLRSSSEPRESNVEESISKLEFENSFESTALEDLKTEENETESSFSSKRVGTEVFQNEGDESERQTREMREKGEPNLTSCWQQRSKIEEAAGSTRA